MEKLKRVAIVVLIVVAAAGWIVVANIHNQAAACENKCHADMVRVLADCVGSDGYKNIPKEW